MIMQIEGKLVRKLRTGKGAHGIDVILQPNGLYALRFQSYGEASSALIDMPEEDMKAKLEQIRDTITMVLGINYRDVTPKEGHV